MSVKEREDREHWADGSVCHTLAVLRHGHVVGSTPSWACCGLCSIMGMPWSCSPDPTEGCTEHGLNIPPN